MCPQGRRHPELSTTPHLAAAEEGRQCLAKAGSPQHTPNHSGCVLSVMQNPLLIWPSPPNPTRILQSRENPLGQAMEKDKLLTQNDTSFKGTPMHNTTPLNTPFNTTGESLQAAQWLASQSLAVPSYPLMGMAQVFHNQLPAVGTHLLKGQQEELPSPWGRITPGSPGEAALEQHQNNPAFPMAHVTPCCSRGWGQRHLFYILQASGKRGFQRDLNTGP